MKIKLIVLLLGVLVCLQPLMWWEIYTRISKGMPKGENDGLDICCSLSGLAFVIGLSILIAYIVEEKWEN